MVDKRLDRRCVKNMKEEKNSIGKMEESNEDYKYFRTES